MHRPLRREAAFEGQERGFGGVVGGLRLWVVCAVGGDGGDEGYGAGEVEGDLFAVHVPRLEGKEVEAGQG